MSAKFYLIMGLAYISIVLLFGLYTYYRDQKERMKRNHGVALYKSRLRTDYSEIIYQYMLRCPLTRGYIAKISRRYEMLCPGKPGDIAKKTMSITGIAFGLCLAVLMFIYILQPSTEHFVLATYIIFVINNEIINFYVNGAEIRLRMEQERFISNVGRNFFSNYYIDDAILRSMDSPMSKEMRVHAQALYEITISNNMREEVERYNATSHDKFMKMLLSLCVNVVERSNGSEKENNMLAANLINLKKEINLDYLKMKKLQFVFSGSIFAAVAVCLPLSAIQEFGLYISPELVSFYKGLLGILYICLIYLCSVIVYLLTNSAKEVKRPTVRNYRYLEIIEENRLVKMALKNFNEKNYSRMLRRKDTLKRLGENITPNQLLLKSALISLCTLLFGITFVLVMHSNTKTLLLKNVNDVGTLSSAATEDQLSTVRETILYYINKYKGEVVLEDELKSEISKENNLRNELVTEKIVDEVIKRNKKYKKEYFKYYELLICIAISVIAFFTPYLLILYRKKLMLGVMDDEVVQFNSIIYMMMYSDYITVADILEQMEIFAVVFKCTIQECLNEFNSGDIEALERMKEQETNDSFRHLVSNLIRCDDMPICKAFNEIAADRENYFERRKQEEEFSIQRKADSIKPLAFLPGILVMIYLIMPVVVMSLKALQDVLALLKENGMY
jgi:hypothetical protein